MLQRLRKKNIRPSSCHHWTIFLTTHSFPLDISKEREKEKEMSCGRLNASWKISSSAVDGQSFLVIDGSLLNLNKKRPREPSSVPRMIENYCCGYQRSTLSFFLSRSLRPAAAGASWKEKEWPLMNRRSNFKTTSFEEDIKRQPRLSKRLWKKNSCRGLCLLSSSWKWSCISLWYSTCRL